MKRLVSLIILCGLNCGLAPTAIAGTVTDFDAGSIVIPMDANLQNQGILDAYGLVYRLLDNGFPSTGWSPPTRPRAAMTSRGCRPT